MDDTVFTDPRGSDREPSLRTRPAAAIAIAEFLRIQAGVAPRSAVARIFGATVLSDESRSRYFDVIGDLAVAAALDDLGTEWVVLHAIPVESRESAIDHVVIGPGGVFTLSSKHHARQIVSVGDHGFHVSGTRVNHIRDTEFDIGRVERRLAAAAGQPIHVVGVIVVVDPGSLTVRAVPSDIAVLRADELVQWLRERPSVLDASCVSIVADIAERPSTWVLGEVCVPDGARLVADFDVVRRAVRTATTAHRLWLFAVSTALVGMLVLAAWGVLVQSV